MSKKGGKWGLFSAIVMISYFYYRRCKKNSRECKKKKEEEEEGGEIDLYQHFSHCQLPA